MLNSTDCKATKRDSRAVPSMNIKIEEGINAKTTNPPVAKTETDIQIERFV